MTAFALDIDDYTEAWREMAACLRPRDAASRPAMLDELYRIAQGHAAPLQSLVELSAAMAGAVPDVLRRVERAAAEARNTIADIDQRRDHFAVMATTGHPVDFPDEMASFPHPGPLDAEEEMLVIDNALLRFFGSASARDAERDRLARGLAALEASFDEDTPAVLTGLAPLIRSLLEERESEGASRAATPHRTQEGRAAQAAALLAADDVNLAFACDERPDEQALAAPDWWPDWSGDTCVIVAGGPSAMEFDAARVQGRVRIIAVNNAVRLAPQADVLFSSDAAWWRHHGEKPAFKGLCLSTDPEACGQDSQIRRIYLAPERGAFPIDGRNRIGWLGNSGSHALNLAVQFGCRRIILIGFDMSLNDGLHWHEPHPQGLSNPTARDTDLWRSMTDAVAPLLRAAGVQVINASRRSRLRRYPKMSFAEALRAFGRASATPSQEHTIGQGKIQPR